MAAVFAATRKHTGCEDCIMVKGELKSLRMTDISVTRALLAVSVSLMFVYVASASPDVTTQSKPASKPAQSFERGVVHDKSESDAPSPYFLRLVGDYGIRRFEHHFYSEEWGEMSLVEQFSSTGFSPIVPHVRRYAVRGSVIVGTAASGYFVVDVDDGPDNRYFQGDFLSEAEWVASLDKHGIPRDIPLLDPDVSATTRPDRELRPWNYKWFHGPFGMSDGGIAGSLIIIALASSVLIGLLAGRSCGCTLFVLMTGAASGYVLQSVGDMVCCGGVVAYTPLSYGAYRLGAWIRGLIRKSPHRDDQSNV